MIKIENLVKIYDNGFKAVNNISLEVKKGEIFGIIGMSGAGKSSLIRCINRLEEPTQGNIFIDGKDIVKMNSKELKEARKNMAMIFQSFNLFYQKNVFENIAYPLRINNWKKKDIEERVNTLLEYVNLKEKIYEYPANLSGGQKQRVAIARALAVQPKILLCDEATSALDPQSTKSILELLLKIRDEFNLTIVLITHQMEVVKAICDRAAVLEDGEIIEQDTVLKLFTSPKTATTKKFIENLPQFDDYDELPVEDYKGCILRLGFTKETTTKPIISELIRQKNLDINIISGNIDKIKEGKVGHLIVEIFEKERDMKNVSKEIEFLFQDSYNALNPRMTVEDLIFEPLQFLPNIDRSKKKEIVLELLKQVELSSELLERKRDELSGGQLQRVCLARALSTKPQIVIFDESLSGLDPLFQDKILNLLYKIQKQYHLTYIFISHDFRLCYFLADRIILIDKGKIIEDFKELDKEIIPKTEIGKILLADISKLK